MNDHLTIDELEGQLHAGEREVLDPDTLTTIRRKGSRRRTTVRALTAVGTVAVLAAVGLTVALAGSDSASRGEDRPPVADAPRELSPLAARALAEIPGAVQVSDWQVVLPPPGASSNYWHDSPDETVVGQAVALDLKTYQGVTAYPARAWPAWLYDGTLEFEQSQMGDDGGVPVGSTDNGILVEAGDAYLACTSWKRHACGPSFMTRTADGTLHHNWGMGTDDFLEPGSDMEVFLSKDYSTGAPGVLAFAGLPGTEVARADFVTTTGDVVAGQVSTTLVEGASMMWGRVPGDLAKVVAYDADGEVIEDHPLRACDDPVDCEVR
jgi:hypothetical protein